MREIIKTFIFLKGGFINFPIIKEAIGKAIKYPPVGPNKIFIPALDFAKTGIPEIPKRI